MTQDDELSRLVNDVWDVCGASIARRVEHHVTDLRTQLADTAAMVEAATRVLAWHDKDKHTAGKMTFGRSYVFAQLREALK